MLRQLDRYVELELAGEDVDAAIPGLRAHLDGCPACREEHESLRALVAASSLPSANDVRPHPLGTQTSVSYRCFLPAVTRPVTTEE